MTRWTSRGSARAAPVPVQVGWVRGGGVSTCGPRGFGMLDQLGVSPNASAGVWGGAGHGVECRVWLVPNHS